MPDRICHALSINPSAVYLKFQTQICNYTLRQTTVVQWHCFLLIYRTLRNNVSIMSFLDHSNQQSIKLVLTKFFLVNISSIYIHRQGRIQLEYAVSAKPISNIIMHIPINGTQSVYTLPCESTVHVLGNIYLSEEFCDDFSPQTQTNVNYPYNMLILRHFFSQITHFWKILMQP